MARPESDVDPRKMEVRPRKRKRKDRSKPEPHALNKANEAWAVANLKSRPANPGVLLEPWGEHSWRVTSPHSDPDLWEAELAGAFGSNSYSVMRLFLEHLRHLCAKDYDHDLQRWKHSERELNAALAMVADWQPDNSAQAALAAQMVAIHWMQMRLSSQALNNGGMIMEKDAALAGKLARTFAQLCETMQTLKGKPVRAQQSIKVVRESHHHQHIHVHRDGGGEENVAQPHEARAATVEGRAALPSPVQGNGAVVPFPSGEGTDRLPQARRRKPGGA